MNIKDYQTLIDLINITTFKGLDIDYIYELKTKLRIEKEKLEGA